jgi:hypothetical protein
MSKLKNLKDNFYIQFIALLGVIFVFVGKPVPYSNEYSYLLRLKNIYNAEYLGNDITFATATKEYWLYEHIFGLLTFVFPLEVIGWMGRFFCWSVLLFALMKLAKRWEIPVWMISVSIFLWLFIRQAIIADEWMFGTFEAKCAAYICLIFALDLICEEKDIWAAILLGLAFSFHPIVGLWGIAAAIPAFLIWHRDIFRTAKLTVIAGIFSLIGLIPLLQMRANIVVPTMENLKFFELVKFPHHFDPFAWSRSAILLVIILLAFCIFVQIQIKKAEPPKFLLSFLTILGVYFIFGVFLRFFEQYELMEFTPTRLFAVFIPLFFFFYLSKAYKENLLKKPLQIALLLPIIFLSFWNKLPIRGYEQAKSTYEYWTQEQDETADAFIWLKNNTSKNALIIAPPWRYDFWYLSERAEIVNYNKPIIADISEWQSRLENFTGKVKPEDGYREIEDMEKFYYGLKKEEIDVLATKYNADYLISKTDYPYPIVFSKGDIKIYSLSAIP